MDHEFEFSWKCIYCINMVFTGLPAHASSLIFSVSEILKGSCRGRRGIAPHNCLVFIWCHIQPPRYLSLHPFLQAAAHSSPLSPSGAWTLRPSLKKKGSSKIFVVAEVLTLLVRFTFVSQLRLEACYLPTILRSHACAFID